MNKEKIEKIIIKESKIPDKYKYIIKMAIEEGIIIGRQEMMNEIMNEVKK
jgi:hypothetical protein